MTYEVEGWSGQVVSRGAGIKSALLRDPAGGRYANASPAASWHDEAEIESFAKRGLLTRRELHEHAVADGVVLYAGYDFIGPSEPDRFLLDPTPLSLHSLNAELFVWVGYLPLARALHTLRRWGEKLIADGNDQLLGRTRDSDRLVAAARALNDASRARFCVGLREASDLRYEMFRVMARATRTLHQPLESVYLDAAIDFPASKVDQLRKDVEMFDPREPASRDRRIQPGYGPRTPTNVAEAR
jgi:hypothetical protein